MVLHILALVLAIQSAPQSAPNDEIKDVLARAEALYFEARFSDSIPLLLRANDALQGRPDRLQDKISVKQQLALAYIGMNNTGAAKALLVEIYGLDGNYTLDPQQFSPKVIALANEAKVEQGKARCVAAGIDARSNLQSGNTTGLLETLRTLRPKCPELASFEPPAADLFYKKGLTEYKRNEFSEAVKSLRVALQFAPEHELAAQYLELSQSKLQVMEDRILLQWQKEFEARQFAQAAADYRQMVTMKEVEVAAGRAKAEYRKSLTTLVDSWNLTCASGDWTKMEGIRGQITDMLPDPSFGEDIRGKMLPCAKPEPKPEPPRQELLAKADTGGDTKTTAKKPDPAAAGKTTPKKSDPVTEAKATPKKPDPAPEAKTTQKKSEPVETKTTPKKSEPVAETKTTPKKSEPVVETKTTPKKPDLVADARPPKTPDSAVELKPVGKQCLQMDSLVAMTRLKLRVDPEFPREARAFVQNAKVNVSVKTRIDESGNVTVIDLQGGNPVINGPVRTAIERWKFSPAMDPTGARCVDTDILMTIGK
jgi:outer membrane biosynthesis protein TonB/tetratricopeptide (TPR) repeat protein